MDAAFVESSETGATARSSVSSLQQAKKVLSDARKNDGVGILASRMIEEALIAVRNSLENCPRHGDAHTSGREKFRAFAIAFGLPWLWIRRAIKATQAGLDNDQEDIAWQRLMDSPWERGSIQTAVIAAALLCDRFDQKGRAVVRDFLEAHAQLETCKCDPLGTNLFPAHSVPQVVNNHMEHGLESLRDDDFQSAESEFLHAAEYYVGLPFHCA